MQIRRISRIVFVGGTPFIVLLLIAVVSARASIQSAPPPLPASFYGTVQAEFEINDPTITAIINDVAYATATILAQDNQLVYTIKVPGDDPTTEMIDGGRAGDTILFQVDGRVVAETAVWQSGVNRQLDITVAASAPAVTETETTNTPFSWWLIAIALLFLLGIIVWLWQRRKLN